MCVCVCVCVCVFQVHYQVIGDKARTMKQRQITSQEDEETRRTEEDEEEEEEEEEERVDGSQPSPSSITDRLMGTSCQVSEGTKWVRPKSEEPLQDIMGVER